MQIIIELHLLERNHSFRFILKAVFFANHELPYDHYKYLDARRYSFYIVGEQIMYLDVEVSYNPNYAGLVLNFKQASSDIL